MNSTEPADRPDIIAFPPFIFATVAGVSVVGHFLFPIRVINYFVSASAGAFLAVCAALLAIWAERTMKAVGTNVRPDQPTLAIVRGGPYRFTRNPMYLSLCLLQLAIGLLCDGWIPVGATVVLLLILHFGVVLREERYLEQKFGETYLA